MMTGQDPYRGLNAGFIALCVNFAATGLVSFLTPVRVPAFDEAVPSISASQPSKEAPTA